MREPIKPLEYSSHILQSLANGILLTTAANKRVNTMTIAWGMLGIEWNLPIFITYVRTNRFTRTLLDANPEFTVNVPIDKYDRRIIGIAGTKSGWDMDKVEQLGLHLEAPERISVPAIRELPLTLECKVIYRRLQDQELIPHDIRNACYPQHIDSRAPGLNRDFHICYYGAIVAAYIIR